MKTSGLEIFGGRFLIIKIISLIVAELFKLSSSCWVSCSIHAFVGSLFFLESFRILSYNYFEIQVYSVSLWFVHLDSIMAFDCRKF